MELDKLHPAFARGHQAFDYVRQQSSQILASSTFPRLYPALYIVIALLFVRLLRLWCRLLTATPSSQIH